MYYNKEGLSLQCKRISNSDLFNLTHNMKSTEVKVPTFYIESQDRTVENPDHPTYHQALEVLNVERMRNAEVLIMEECLDLPTGVLKSDNVQVEIDKLRDTTILDLGELSDKVLYLKYFLLDDGRDMFNITNLVSLTETRVSSILESITITRNGVKITEAIIRNRVETGIQYAPLLVGNHQIVNPIDEFNACAAANANFHSWLTGEYGLDDMATMVALYRLNELTKTHSSDAAQIEQERKNARNK